MFFSTVKIGCFFNEKIRKILLESISLFVIGSIVSISGVFLRSWYKITNATQFIKSWKNFQFGAYTARDTIEKAFYKDRKKAIRNVIGIALEIGGIIIIAYAAVTYVSH